MSIGFVSDLVNSFARSLRAIAVLVGLGVTMLGYDFCPTGQTSCDMIGMDEMQTDNAVCVLACGVPFQQSAQAAPAFVGEISILPDPPVLNFAWIITEPDVPPPRTLA